MLNKDKYKTLPEAVKAWEIRKGEELISSKDPISTPNLKLEKFINWLYLPVLNKYCITFYDEVGDTFGPGLYSRHVEAASFDAVFDIWKKDIENQHRELMSIVKEN